VHEVGDRKFELKGCQRSGKKVTCSAWVTQTNKDIKLEYRNGAGYTRPVDAAGLEYSSASIQVGSQIVDNCSGVSSTKDTPLQLSATFADVPTSVQDIALFELGFYDTNLKGQLRNTQITESKGGNTPAIKKKK
jgi:hypothetical protein